MHGSSRGNTDTEIGDGREFNMERKLQVGGIKRNTGRQ